MSSVKFCSLASALAMLLGALSHAKAAPHTQSPLAPPAAPVPSITAETVKKCGIASWYGSHWQGRRTASGARFDDRKFTAANLSLPFKTKARVTNLANGRSVEVTVTDRGPYKEGRMIDLSAAAARALGMLKEGLADVAISAVLAPSRVITR
jgi:rare lipoprotein A